MKKIYIVFDANREVHGCFKSKKEAEKFSNEFNYFFECHVY